MRLKSATLRATVAVSALSSLGLAMILPTPGAIDTSLIRRELTEVTGVPDDMAFWDNPTGNYYADGYGVQSGNSVLLTVPYTDDDGKCWTEIFFVGTTDAYDQWKQIGDDIDCATTSTCLLSTQEMAQKCLSFTWGLTYTASVAAAVAPLGVGVTITSSVAASVGGSYQACNSRTKVDSCTWDDTKCHSMWGASQTTTVHGYKRLSCVGFVNTPPRPDGNVTMGMQNFKFALPGSTFLSCNGTCETSDFTGLLPAIDTAMKPWPTQ
ncbi:hypothetical protein V490_08920 [Pseudogymnoascus sp. VKM F-3557]|nr:hypothetical protein V490_08920 [Pseudogymnoascus sp. VKM F-3557]